MEKKRKDRTTILRFTNNSLTVGPLHLQTREFGELE
jgi:hypothetical protein